jgi:uncharacterized YccA/Bax inhibitor family protein
MNLNSFGSPLLQVRQINSLIAENETFSKLTKKSYFGTLTATFILFLLTVFSFLVVWVLFQNSLVSGDTKDIQQLRNFSFASGVLAFSLAFIANYKVTLSPWIAPLYAIFSGIFLSGLSLSAEMKYPGIALMTIELTAIVFIFMLVGFKLKILQATRKFKAIVYTATATIAMVYLISFVAKFFNLNVPVIHDAGVGSILWSGFIVTIASLNLIIDFDRISKIKSNIPAYMHWRIALGLMVTLVWLYFSVLRLLQKIRR